MGDFPPPLLGALLSLSEVVSRCVTEAESLPLDPVLMRRTHTGEEETGGERSVRGRTPGHRQRERAGAGNLH